MDKVILKATGLTRDFMNAAHCQQVVFKIPLAWRDYVLSLPEPERDCFVWSHADVKNCEIVHGT